MGMLRAAQVDVLVNETREVAVRGGLSVVREDVRVVEEGFPATVSIVTMRRSSE